jgi:hypothetical protein
MRTYSYARLAGREMAVAMAKSGLPDAGYSYINIDDMSPDDEHSHFGRAQYRQVSHLIGPFDTSCSSGKESA